MNYNKKLFNYIIWGLLCILSFAGIGVSAIGVSESASNDAYLIYVGVFYVIFLVLCTILILGFKAVYKALDGKDIAEKFKVGGVLETVLVVVVAVTALIIRFSLVITMVADAEGTALTVAKGSSAYYDYAIGTLDTLGTATNGAYLFTGILRLLFSAFGQSIVVVYVFQAVLTLGILLFVFYAMKLADGKIAAWISLLLISFIPGSIELFMYCTPGLLYAFLLSGYFLGIVLLFRAAKAGKVREDKHLVFYGAAGLYAGFLCYFDPSALILLFITVLSFYCFKDTSSLETSRKPGAQSLVYAGCAILFLLVSLFAFPAGVSVGVTGIARYFMLFVPRDGINLTILTPHYGVWDSILLYSFTGIWLLAFLKSRKDEAFPFSILSIVLILFQLMTFDHVDYNPLISLCFILIGTVGLTSLRLLALPGDVNSKEEYTERLAEFEEKRREKENHKFAKRIEKENKKGAFSKSQRIILGKDVHMTVEEDTEEKPAEVVAEVTAEVAADTVAKTEESAETGTGENTLGESASTDEAVKKEEGGAVSEDKKEETTGSEETEKVADADKAAEEAARLKAEEEAKAAEEAARLKAEEEAKAAEEAARIKAEEEAKAAEEAARIKAEEEAKAAEEAARIKAEEEAKAAEEAARLKAEEEAKAAETAVNPEEAAPEVQPAPVKKELPPYVPQKMMIRRRGKMFSPVKKAEPAPENTSDSPVVNDAPLADIAVKTAEEAAVAAETVAPVAEAAVVTETVAPVEEPAAVAETVTPAVETGVVAETSATVEEVPAQDAGMQISDAIVQAVPEAPMKTDSMPNVAANVSKETKSEEAKSEETSPADNADKADAKKKAEETASNENKTEDNGLFKNPVPGPKAHVPRELAYDYNPKEEEMDFDIKDLTGKDFYDV